MNYKKARITVIPRVLVASGFVVQIVLNNMRLATKLFGLLETIGTVYRMLMTSMRRSLRILGKYSNCCPRIMYVVINWWLRQCLLTWSFVCKRLIGCGGTTTLYHRSNREAEVSLTCNKTKVMKQ